MWCTTESKITTGVQPFSHLEQNASGIRSPFWLKTFHTANFSHPPPTRDPAWLPVAVDPGGSFLQPPSSVPLCQLCFTMTVLDPSFATLLHDTGVAEVFQQWLVANTMTGRTRFLAGAPTSVDADLITEFTTGGGTCLEHPLRSTHLDCFHFWRGGLRPCGRISWFGGLRACGRIAGLMCEKMKN